MRVGTNSRRPSCVADEEQGRFHPALARTIAKNAARVPVGQQAGQELLQATRYSTSAGPHSTFHPPWRRAIKKHAAKRSERSPARGWGPQPSVSDTQWAKARTSSVVSCPASALFVVAASSPLLADLVGAISRGARIRGTRSSLRTRVREDRERAVAHAEETGEDRQVHC